MEEARSDHDLLIKLETKLDAVINSLNELKDGTAEKIKDHEKRIRFLERYVSGAIAVAVVAEVVVRIMFK